MNMTKLHEIADDIETLVQCVLDIKTKNPAYITKTQKAAIAAAERVEAFLATYNEDQVL